MESRIQTRRGNVLAIESEIPRDFVRDFARVMRLRFARADGWRSRRGYGGDIRSDEVRKSGMTTTTTTTTTTTLCRTNFKSDVSLSAGRHPAENSCSLFTSGPFITDTSDRIEFFSFRERLFLFQTRLCHRWGPRHRVRRVYSRTSVCCPWRSSSISS